MISDSFNGEPAGEQAVGVGVFGAQYGKIGVLDAGGGRLPRNLLRRLCDLAAAVSTGHPTGAPDTPAQQP